MPDTPSAEQELLSKAAAGDAAAWGALLAAHEERLRRAAAFRLDPRLRGRIDAGDVVQEAFAEAAEHRAAFFDQAPLPLFLWLRGIVSNKLLELHRRHLGTRMRDAGREIAGGQGPGGGDATSVALVAELTGGGQGPGTAAARDEAFGRVRDALAAMTATDREVLALRHFEQLTNGEAARVLGIEERAAAKRYVRALRRLKEALADMPGGLTGLGP
jgi:RNA polymerase sigma-70 factor (ECF subfamily)